MVKLFDVQELFSNTIFNSRVIDKSFPQHVTVTTTSFKQWLQKTKQTPGQAAQKHTQLLNTLLDWQIKKDLPILTIHLPQTEDEYKTYLKAFLDDLAQSNIVKDNKIRIFVVGKWYDLPPSMVDSIKNIMSQTRDYDTYFLNLCINYDGQDEIVSSHKLMARKIQADKLQLEDIRKDIVKDNLYTSYFLPPQLVVEPGYNYSGALLWDIQGAVIHFAKKHWLEFDKRDLDEAVQRYSKAAEFNQKDKKEDAKEENEEKSKE